jgi:hypothetical protein
MALNLLDKIINYTENKRNERKLTDTKRAYVDCLQLMLSKILDDPNKIRTGMYKKPVEYSIQISDHIITHLEPKYKLFNNNTVLNDVIKQYENIPARCENNIIDIKIRKVSNENNNTETILDNTIEILLQDHKSNYEKPFTINSTKDYQRAKEEICEYIQHGMGLWVYSLTPGKIFE